MSVVAVVDHRFGTLDIEQRVLEPIGAEIQDCAGLGRDEALAICAEADAILVGARFRFDPSALATLGRCKAIVRYGIGYDNVDAACAGIDGIWVATVPDYCITEVADHTIACLLLLNRRLVEFDAAVRRGAWGIPPGCNIRRLSESTLGVIGFGRIGEAVASRAISLGMRVLAHDPVRPEADIRAVGAEPAELDRMLPLVNYLTFHAPPSPDGPLLNARRFELLADGAAVINVARGGLIDEEALISRLHSGHLAGAALDVANAEPVGQDDALLSAPNVLITPHAAWYSEQAVAELREKAASEAARVLGGNRPLHAVNELA